ncbi:helix-turn-helix domain-containing protein [Erwinia pyrifoliae]|uniref:Helix-turn-helix domain-containing protein n=1 Tax=Erwinia pyrifoliae TaxID=79967 RepID=A0ABY5X3K2_ERWPY|nr:helix-turn-helix domain-containing protein [Erwinia pyrifoliae]AUX72465.1 helix-turn-helix domain-containing protein [Erwinia pyrifoliae]MCA8877284.1 helix-turn-helix domain-containing protein [Erwinia pyrifoliae]MCT2385129.1 helix-turn-helix domain-containing protein [Erwinia pyrifoliae]MCT2388770.1 helix-turn-helix domain-containing protein [Erwinia pyrifoliae]MCU8585647.1 helix-turn-helix domain-containing protein [Erwinia pyrifoliae]
MSSKLHGLVWEGCGPSGMTLSRIAVLARLADYSNDEGYSWPAVDTIREQVGAKSKTTVRAAIKELESAGWLSVKERTSGGRNISNAYQLDVEKLEQAAEAARKKKRRVSKTDPSNINPSNSDRSNFEGSNNVTSGGQNLVGEGSTIDPDPLRDPKTDPSDKKTVGRPALPADEQQSEGSLKINYDDVLTAYHEILPEMPKVLALTDDRRGKLRFLWKKFEFNQNRWAAYLRFIAKNCRWMLENRPDAASGKTWRKKSFDYLITVKCYIAVIEKRANDLPTVARVNGAERDDAFSRLVANPGKPRNRVEELARGAASGLGRMNEVMGRAAWKSIWAEAVRKASEENVQRPA